MEKITNSSRLGGIVGYGAYIPIERIKVSEIAAHHHQNPDYIVSNLGIEEKSSPGKDEDTATIAVQAAQHAMQRTSLSPHDIGAIYVGSESHPYAVKPTATIVGQALGATDLYMAADLEFACKAGTAALQICCGLVSSNMIHYGLAIGADTAQGAPGDVLEYSASAAGAAFIVGNNPDELIATIDTTISISSNTPDFWRRPMQPYPEHTFRFTGEPAYFKHIIHAAKHIMEQAKLKQTDFDYVVFHQPNGKFPLIAAKKLGFSKEQIIPGLVVTQVGNSYSASSMISLAAVLDQAQPNQKILVVSYGSGSGSDAFVITTTPLLTKKQTLAPTTDFYIKRKKYVSYASVLLQMASS